MYNMTVATANQGAALQPNHDITGAMFADFVSWLDRCKTTARAYTTNLRQFAAWLSYSGIVRPLRNDIINYRNWLTVEHDAIMFAPDTAAGWVYRTDHSGNPVKVCCKPNTAAQYLRSVCAFFRWTAASGLYPDIAANVHAPKVGTADHKKDALTPVDVLRIEQSIAASADLRREEAQAAAKDRAGRQQRADEQGKRLAAMYTLAVNAGLRDIELHRANIRDIEVKGAQITLYVHGKGHTEADQRKALAPEVYGVIRDYLDSRTDKYNGNSPLFVSTGNRSKGKRIAVTTIGTMLKRAMQAAGFDSERITAHSLRHTAGTAVMSMTGNLYTTQKYMRHANPATTEIYIHTEDSKAEADTAARLYGYYHGQQLDNSERLHAAMTRMNAKQLEQLAAIAEAMA